MRVKKNEGVSLFGEGVKNNNSQKPDSLISPEQTKTPFDNSNLFQEGLEI
jgi:hypothetical protein